MCDEHWKQIERTDEKNVKRLLNIYKYKEDYPKLAEYTAMWDTFYFGATSKKFIKAFHYAFESYDFDALSPLLNTLNEDQGIYEAAKIIGDMITDGLSIIEYLAANAEQYLRAYGFETTFEGYKVYAINRALINSDFFESIDASKYDMFIGFSFNGGVWEYQLRSAEQDKVNVYELAVKHGGGGHPNAAGFRSDKYVLGV